MTLDTAPHPVAAEIARLDAVASQHGDDAVTAWRDRNVLIAKTLTAGTLTNSEIATLLGVTPSRVSQLARRGSTARD